MSFTWVRQTSHHVFHAGSGTLAMGFPMVVLARRVRHGLAHARLWRCVACVSQAPSGAARANVSQVGPALAHLNPLCGHVSTLSFTLCLVTAREVELGVERWPVENTRYSFYDRARASQAGRHRAASFLPWGWVA